MVESVTGNTGGVSMRTMSYSSRTARRNSPMADVDKSSDGLAGTGPASMMCRLSRPGDAMMSSISKRPISMSETVRMQSRHCALPMRMSERPGSRSMPKKRWMLGRRRATLDEPLDRRARVDVRHHAQHRDLEVRLDVFDGADRGVERLLDEGEHEAEDQ